jgi:two-component system sensor histidine kinase AlgZ
MTLGNRRGALLYLLISLGLGLLLGALVAVATATAWSNALLLTVPATLVFAVAAGFSTYYLCRAYPLDARHPLIVFGVMLAAAVFSSVLWVAITQLWNSFCLLAGLAWAGMVMGPALSVPIFGAGIVLYGLAAALNYLLIEFARARSAERRELESQLLAREAQLRMLRSQIDPHFLFNSLNSISALTAIDAVRAREMTLQLASFFRQSLGMEAHTRVTLNEELVLMRHFLAIEQVRFGERLRVEETVTAAASACLVPPMIVQPLVENAIKHGISQLTEGGTIFIEAACVGSQLRIVVANHIDGDGDGGNVAAATGVGLANVRQRLAGFYRHEAAVHWGRRDQLFRVEMSMPAQTAHDDSRHRLEA